MMRRTFVTVAALVSALLLATGVYAAIPSADGTAVSCYNKGNGLLRVIDSEAGDTCASNETQLRLSTPHDHFSGIVRVHDDAWFDGFAGQMITARAECPPGKILLSGGYTLRGNANEASKVDIFGAVPVADPSIGEFAYEVRAITSDAVSTPWGIRAFAVCTS